MRADGRDHERFQVRLDDRAAARERVGGRAGRARDDDAVAGVRVDVAAVHAGIEVERAAGVVLLHHDVVDRERLRVSPVRLVQARRQQLPPVGLQLARERRIHPLQHVLRHDIGEEAEAAAIDAEQRHGVARHQARRVQQRAIAADGDHEVGPRAELGVSDSRDARAGHAGRVVLAHQHLDPAAREVRQQRAHALGDARILESAH